MGDLISRQAAIDALAEQMPQPFTPDGSHPADEGIFMAQEIYADCIETLKLLPSAQPDNSCDGCKYENADDGVLVPCGFCKRSHPDNYERRTNERET